LKTKSYQTDAYASRESLLNFLLSSAENRKSPKLILTEKWRDVERPLSNDAKILKIWTAWGDEKKFVKFVVKRVSERSQSSSNNHRKRLRRRGSVSSVDELHPKALHIKSKAHDKTHPLPPDPDKDVIEEMMKIIEIQRKVISDELMKAKKKAKKSPITLPLPQQCMKNEQLKSEKIQKDKVRLIMDEMTKLSHLNEKLQFAEESVDRLEIAVKQQLNSDQHPGSSAQAEDKYLIHNHLACAKTEVSKLRSANDLAAVEVKDNQKALDKMEEAKAERKLALKRLEYDVNVIEKEGRKLAKEYEKVLSINIEDIIETTHLDQKEPSEPSENEEEIYALLNSTSVSIISNKTDQAENVSTTSGNSSEDHSSVQDIISKESPIDEKNVNSTNQDENNSDTGLSSLHTSSDEGSYEVGTLV